MKNTLIFLITEGIGLNKKWKGNYLKLANKPNLNYLISGIYPWALLGNERKRDKEKKQKSYFAVKNDVDANFYEMFYGQTDIKTYLEMLDEQINSKSLQNLSIFAHLVEHSYNSGSKIVHIFSMLSDNTLKFNHLNLRYIINILISKGLKPVLHLIADGQDEKPNNFNVSLVEFNKFIANRNTPIVTIAGRNKVFGKKGLSHLDNHHIMPYFETICGLSTNGFNNANEFANEQLINQIADADIAPTFNNYAVDYFLNKKDAIMFLNADPDDFASLAAMIKSEKKLEGMYLTGLAPVYGVDLDQVFFSNPIESKEENLITNVITSNSDNNLLVLGLNHKKGFMEKYFGKGNQNPKIDRKIVWSPYVLNEGDYFKLTPKILIDKTIDSIGKYDAIFVHIPFIAEAARTGDLKLLIKTIENFDIHLGRLINICRCTANIIAFVSAYGSAEKMLDRHLNIIPYNTRSLVPFVYTNGDLSSKHMKSNFLGVYSSILSTLDSLNEDHKLFYTSLINSNFTKKKIEQDLSDAFQIWKTQVADDLINKFENERLNFYDEFSKDPEFFAQKQKYIVLKEIVNLHNKILLTQETRKKLYGVLLDYVEYNHVDFVGLDINYQKTFATFYEEEIKNQKLTKAANRYFDKKIWLTNFNRNENWINNVKTDVIANITRSYDPGANKNIVNNVVNEYLPFLFFEKIKKSELEVLKTNDAQKIYDFYTLIKEEVNQIYDDYIANKVSYDEEEDEEYDEYEEKDPQQIENERILYETASYYDFFNDVVSLVSENKDKIEWYNQKYQENIDYLKKNNKEFQFSDLYKAPTIALNPIVVKILAIYKLHKNDISTYFKSLQTENKKSNFKYNLAYKNKVNLAKQAIVYEGEFEEDVNLAKQGDWADQFLAHANLYGEFDNTMVEFFTEKELEELNKPEGEEEIEFDEDGNPIIIDDINVRIKTRPEYDLMQTWVDKRKDEYKNVDNIKANVAIDAQDKVYEKSKAVDARTKVKEYHQQSEAWKQKQQTSWSDASNEEKN